MIYDVDIVAVPEQAIVILRGTTSLAEIVRCRQRLRDLVAQAGLMPAGRVMARFYEDEPGPEGPRYDVALPVVPRDDGRVPDAVGKARGEWLPLHHVLETVHVGPHDAMGDAWRALHEAADALGYSQAGPLTEVYECDASDGVSPEKYVTRVRLPYAR